MSHSGNCKQPDGVTCPDCVDYGKLIATERIIKLLEERASNLLSHDGSECNCKVQGEECLAIIERIKGEQK